MPLDGRAAPQERAAVRTKREQRRQQVAAGLLAGLSYRELARGLKCSFSTIQDDIRIIRVEWAETRITDFDALVTQESQRLDRLQAKFWQKALGGDVDAAVIVLRCIDRRIRLLGLDASTRAELSVTLDGRVDISASVEWVELRAKLVGVLTAFPAAQEAVIAALTDGAAPEDGDGDE